MPTIGLDLLHRVIKYSEKRLKQSIQKQKRKKKEKKRKFQV